jgi:hypothetical protein
MLQRDKCHTLETTHTTPTVTSPQRQQLTQQPIHKLWLSAPTLAGNATHIVGERVYV